MLGNIDAVHGLYYLLMHGWFVVFPATEFWSRLSSSLAVGIAAAGVVVLGKQLSTRPVALAAGVAFALLPRVTWAGIEVRSYALTMVAGVWLTVFCVAAVRRNGLRWWLGYAVLVILGTLLNVFLVLLVAVHAVVVAVLARSPKVLWRWAVVAAVAVGVVTPFLVFTQTQLFQVGWISPLSAYTVGEILQEQYFDHALPFAVLSGLMIVFGLLSWRRTGDVGRPAPRSAGRRRRRVGAGADGSPARLLGTATPDLLSALSVLHRAGHRSAARVLHRGGGPFTRRRHRRSAGVRPPPRHRIICCAARPVRQGGHGLQPGRRCDQPLCRAR